MQKQRGITAKTLSIITDISEGKIEEVYNLPLEKLEIFVNDNDTPVAQGNKLSAADEYYLRWYDENPQEACRFLGVCNKIIQERFSDDATSRVQRVIDDWLFKHLGLTHQTLSTIISIEPGDIESFLSAPDSLPVDVRYRIVLNTIRFNEQLNRFITKVDPKITIPDNKNAAAF